MQQSAVYDTWAMSVPGDTTITNRADIIVSSAVVFILVATSEPSKVGWHNGTVAQHHSSLVTHNIEAMIGTLAGQAKIMLQNIHTRP